MIRCTVGNNSNRHPVTIDENTTLRAAFEENGVDYSIGMNSLDGSTLIPGDLDKTFADFGITDKCYLLNITKADNAACVKIVGSVCVIESAYPRETIKTLEKYRPKALILYEGENGQKEEVFRVGLGKGKGSINQYGVSFGTATSGEDAKATVTLDVPEGTTDVKAWAEETIGTSILMLNKVEEQFAGAIDEVATEKAAVSSYILAV